MTPAHGASVSETEFTFKLASEPGEFDQIHRLNYRTFVEEIPQHDPNEHGALVDRFNVENAYVICRRGDRVLGMLAVRGTRPFSLDDKLPDLDSYLPAGRSLCEIRLLAVEPALRTGVVLRGLVSELLRHCVRAGYELAVISGTTRQLKLYDHLGFVPFGPRVGTSDAEYQPMYLTRDAMLAHVGHLVQEEADPEAACFLPGPVTLAANVRRRLAAPLISHRSDAFTAELQDVRAALRTMTGAEHAAICVGSGTLANDIVAAQLALSGEPVAIITNGEFGERLADHARRHRLRHTVVSLPWGSPIGDRDVDAAFAALPAVRWLWVTHCETSTGMINDIPTLLDACARHGAQLAVDAISSIGTMPVDLSRVAFASGASGKGLGAAAGLSIVFASRRVAARPDAVPRYLDLGLYLATEGTPFTQPSSLVGALVEAVRTTDWPARYFRTAEASARLRARLLVAGVRPLVNGPHAAPAVTTWVVTPARNLWQAAQRLQRAGYLVGSRSDYLAARGWLQVAFMGDFPTERVDALADAMTRVLAP